MGRSLRHCKYQHYVVSHRCVFLHGKASSGVVERVRHRPRRDDLFAGNDFVTKTFVYLAENVYLRSQMKITKNKYLLGFAVSVILLAFVKMIFPSVAEPLQQQEAVAVQQNVDDAQIVLSSRSNVISRLFTKKKHRIRGVNNYREAFPDSQAVQIMAAEKWGVRPVKNREDAERRKKELVYVGSNPYYHVDPLYSSIPYLVPRAAVLLQDIGQAFYDSLYVKGVPFNQFIVTSVLRSESDVVKLRRRNGNATERSCHLFGTTFDICYNRYHPVTQPVRDDTLKWVLCEVLRDMREQGRCYIKYEVKQGCFHMTVR